MSEVKVKIKMSTGYFLKAPRLKNPPSYPIPAYGGCPHSLDGGHTTPVFAFVVTLPSPILTTHVQCHYIGTTWIIENENLPISRSLN